MPGNVRNADFPLEIYYSCVDWHHKAYPDLGRHHEVVTDPQYHDMNEYTAFLKNQIRKLCSNYGTIHGIWWNMNVPELQVLRLIFDPSVYYNGFKQSVSQDNQAGILENDLI